VSLFAYGLESGVEIFASAVVVLQLKNNTVKEQLALKLIGGAYIIVSVYIFSDAAKSLLTHNHSQRSFLGIIILIITICGMLWLGFSKLRIGQKMGSISILADAKFTLIDAILAAIVIFGLLANALLGWWWSDPVMALFLSGVAFHEGMKDLF
jgi:divalent metal cation (Fe/Co/Zn/Cd) transporter